MFFFSIQIWSGVFQYANRNQISIKFGNISTPWTWKKSVILLGILCWQTKKKMFWHGHWYNLKNLCCVYSQTQSRQDGWTIGNQPVSKYYMTLPPLRILLHFMQPLPQISMYPEKLTKLIWEIYKNQLSNWVIQHFFHFQDILRQQRGFCFFFYVWFY